MSEKKKTPQDTYQVGYRKPPAHSRFRKGQSGNPTGQRRRPGETERLKKIISQEAYRLLTVRDGGDIKRIAAVQAVLRSQITSAVKGNVSAQIPIVALSAHALAGEREKALAAGCDELDTKPIDFDRLIATLRRCSRVPQIMLHFGRPDWLALRLNKEARC